MQKITKYQLISSIFAATMTMVYFVFNKVLQPFTFEIIVFCVAFCIMVKAIVLNSDSNLWFSLVLTGICVIMMLDKLQIINLRYMWPLIIIDLAVCSMVVALIFKDYMQLNMSILFTLIGSVSMMYTHRLIKVVWYIVLLVASVLVQMLISALIIDKIKRIK